MTVGVGEAGGSPPSYSLISDYFPAKERGTGLALYSLGVPLGSMLGTALGGGRRGRLRLAHRLLRGGPSRRRCWRC